MNNCELFTINDKIVLREICDIHLALNIHSKEIYELNLFSYNLLEYFKAGEITYNDAIEKCKSNKEFSSAETDEIISFLNDCLNEQIIIRSKNA